jgi:hypothetical protein
MSGSLSGGNPLLSGGGVASNIPLQAGVGVQQSNPLQSVGNFADAMNKVNQLKLFPGQQTLQQQSIQSNAAALYQQQKQLAYAQLAPLIQRGLINNADDVTTALGHMEANGTITSPIIDDMTRTAQMGGDFVGNMKALTAAGVVPPEKSVAAVSPTPGTLNTGGQIIPLLTPAPGMPGQGVPVPSAPGFSVGYTPGQQMEGIHRPATQADVAAGRASAIGQDLIVPATTLPGSAGYNPGVGGARVPPGALGPGGYAAPRQPLTQLGAPYAPAGATAGGAPRLMRGPGGAFMVPPDKVQIFQQNGYQ